MDLSLNYPDPNFYQVSTKEVRHIKLKFENIPRNECVAKTKNEIKDLELCSRSKTDIFVTFNFDLLYIQNHL